MSVDEVKCALAEMNRDAVLVATFLGLWPRVEEILDAFSVALALPIFGYLGAARVYSSPPSTLPAFCKAMLSSGDTKTLCLSDAAHRAIGDGADREAGALCHAGLSNRRRIINTGCVGDLVLHFGARRCDGPEAKRRQGLAIDTVRQHDARLAEALAAAAQDATWPATIAEPELRLMRAVGDLLERLLHSTLGFQHQTIQMTHEVVLVLDGVGLLAMDLQTRDEGLTEASIEREVSGRIIDESRLAMYVVRNFLSAASESRYQEIAGRQFEEVDLAGVLEDMVALYRRRAQEKGVAITTQGLEILPRIRGMRMEILRLFHNVLSNAVKYTYHSTQQASRDIRIRSLVPYDPGFARHEFGIAFENYGLGVEQEEERQVFRQGFRGKQAIAEVPIGAGIGLTEAAKIMRVHKGRIRLRSRKLHGEGVESDTYLTRVDVVFPWIERKGDRHGS